VTYTVTGNWIEFNYDAAGMKISKTTNTGVTKNYAGGIEYSGSNLEAIYTSEGRATPNGANYRYEYSIKDHLGNSRLMFQDSSGIPKILQESHYHPFGMEMEASYYAMQMGTENGYQYNGKELNDDFGLNWLDYGARWYMPDIRRWGQIDPLAEKYYSYSPYNYTLNNPLRYIDPDGMSVFGDIYNLNGQWIGSDRVDDQRVFISNTNDNTELTQAQAAGTIFLHDNFKQVTGGVEGGGGLTMLNVQHDELLLLAGTAYGESGTGNVTEEISGIASAIVNNNNARGEGASLTETINEIAYAASDGNARFNAFEGATPTERNGDAGMTAAVGGAINAFREPSN